MKPLAAALLLVAALLAGCATDDAAEPAPTPAASPTAEAPARGPLALTVATPAPTAGERVTLTGTVSRATTLVFHVVEGGNQVTGTLEADVAPDWTVEVPIGRIGRSEIDVFPKDASETASATVTAVRLGAYTVAVDYAGYPGLENSEDTVLLDPDALLSAPTYAERGAQHPGTPIVHDLLVAWEAQTGNAIEYGWSDEFDAYSVNRINGAGNPVTASLPPWWCYKVNGGRAELGISLQPIAPGDTVLWDLGACA